MLFNSQTFLVFFALVYAGYCLLHRRYRAQNVLLLVASYIFYGAWDWRFCSLLAISTVVDFVVGNMLADTEDPRRRKQLLTLSVLVNLGILGFFKYFNFFAESAAELLSLLGMHPDSVTLNIVLPVGISFYTFQTMSYTIDIYRGTLQPTRRLIDFALYVAFFPQLVAGPIERAWRLLPQITSPRVISADQINAGLFLTLWGYFKKVVVADNLAVIANEIFNGYTNYHGLDLVVGILAFTGQIYCDFSGYSDIARGVAKLMGFDLMVNFKLPYFATTPSDFWQRWHISLSSWLRDYLYIPLGGNRGSVAATYRNLALTMLLGGLWHGAAWPFVIWGAYHGLLLVIYRLLGSGGESTAKDQAGSGISARLRTLAAMAFMFLLTVIGWVIFRSDSVHQIVYMLTRVGLDYDFHTMERGYDLMFFTVPLLVVQIFQQRSGDLLIMTKLPLVWRVLFSTWLLLWIFAFGVRKATEFIYFQF